MKAKAELLLHPVRMKIMQTLIGGRRLTVQQMAARLPEIAQATLYRHLNALLAGGLLTVVDSKPIRGAVERVYALAENGGQLTESELSEASREDHMQYFLQFVAGVIGDFGTYLGREDIDLLRDGVGYKQAALYLSDEELASLTQTLRDAINTAMRNEPSPERKKRTLTTILIPE